MMRTGKQNVITPPCKIKDREENRIQVRDAQEIEHELAWEQSGSYLVEHGLPPGIARILDRYESLDLF